METVEKEFIFKRINNGFLINNYFVNTIREHINLNLLKQIDEVANDIKLDNIKLSFKLTSK